MELLRLLHFFCGSVYNDLDQPKLKALTHTNGDVAEMKEFACQKVENTVGKAEDAGYQHFLLFPQCFQKPYSTGSFRVPIAAY